MSKRFVNYLSQKQGKILTALLSLIFVLFIGILVTAYIVAKRANPVMLDEAGQVSGKQMAELVRLVKSGNGRLILSGDTRQHGPVEASDAMLALERYAYLKPAELKKIRRQDPKLGRANEENRDIRRYRRAVADAAAGKLADSFAGLEQLGAVVACPLGDQSERLAEEYLRLCGDFLRLARQDDGLRFVFRFRCPRRDEQPSMVCDDFARSPGHPHFHVRQDRAPRKCAAVGRLEAGVGFDWPGTHPTISAPATNPPLAALDSRLEYPRAKSAREGEVAPFDATKKE